MDELSRWAPTVITLLAAAAVYGGLSKQTDTNTKAIEDLQLEQDNQWTHINRTRVDVGTLQGRLGVAGSNNDDLPPAGPRQRRAAKA